MDIIDTLTELFKEFPGIGERQAKRFVYFLMFKNKNYSESLARGILELKQEVSQCSECFRFFIAGKMNSRICTICANPNIERDTLMVVEKDSDLESVHKSGFYNGKYFILGGLVPIVEKNTKSRVRIEELKQKIKKEIEHGGLKEIIIAFSLNPQGDYTDSYIREEIKGLTDLHDIKVSSLGKGLSTGTELEYSDNDTLKNALKNRQ